MNSLQTPAVEEIRSLDSIDNRARNEDSISTCHEASDKKIVGDLKLRKSVDKENAQKQYMQWLEQTSWQEKCKIN